MCEPLENKVSAQDLDHEICIHCHFDWVIIWSSGVGPISKSVTYFSRCLAGNQISISVPFVRTIKTEPTRWVQTQLWRSSSIKFNRRSAEEIDLFFCASASIFIQLCSHLMEKLTLNHIFILLMEKHSCLRFFNHLFFPSWQFSSVPPLLCYGFHVDVVSFFLQTCLTSSSNRCFSDYHLLQETWHTAWGRDLLGLHFSRCDFMLAGNGEQAVSAAASFWWEYLELEQRQEMSDGGFISVILSLT